MKHLLPLLTALLPLSLPADDAARLLASDVGEGEFVHCFDFGCKSRRAIDFSPCQWAALERLFALSVDDAADEKQRIRAAIALMERFAGALTGTEADRGGNYSGKELSRQQDCIDESTNTLQYLLALERRGWLRFHRVDLKQRRIVWFISHWTATIRETASGELFAVDSWFRDNGEPPYIQPLADWRRDRDFPAVLNPPLTLPADLETAAR